MAASISAAEQKRREELDDLVIKDLKELLAAAELPQPMVWSVLKHTAKAATGEPLLQFKPLPVSDEQLLFIYSFQLILCYSEELQRVVYVETYALDIFRPSMYVVAD
jgi:hypothetical protein